MEKKMNIWNDYQNQKNYDLSFKTVDDNAPDHIILKETKDDRGKNGEQWNFKIVSKNYIDSKNAEQDETARQQQAQITEHSHTLREHDEKLVNIKEKNTEQDNKLSELENKNTEQDGKILEIENKNTEQDNKLNEHENRLEQLDGGHSSNLGKIGEIETKLENHKERIESLETETENYNLRVFKKNLSPLELKLDKILSLVKATITITTKKKETYVSHLNGLYLVDEKNNHNNCLNLFTDSKDNEKLFHIELSGDESFLIKIIHTKNIEIEEVIISEFSQIAINIPKDKSIDERFLPISYRAISADQENTYFYDTVVNTHFTPITEYSTLIEIDTLFFIDVKNISNYKGLEIGFYSYLNNYFMNEVLPKKVNNIPIKDWLYKGYAFLVINGKNIQKNLEVKLTGNRLSDVRFMVSPSEFNLGVNFLQFRFNWIYNSKDEKINA